jgi:UDP-N-acetylglucosamine/UDP-N-acetylgalactosamine diphosphorylase
MAILENARAECFSPLKNKAGTGADDPETSRRDLLAQQERWILAAGADLQGHELELAPCISLAGEGLESIRGKTAIRSGAVSSASQLAAAFE